MCGHLRIPAGFSLRAGFLSEVGTSVSWAQQGFRCRCCSKPPHPLDDDQRDALACANFRPRRHRRKTASSLESLQGTWARAQIETCQIRTFEAKPALSDPFLFFWLFPLMLLVWRSRLLTSSSSASRRASCIASPSWETGEARFASRPFRLAPRSEAGG